MNTWNDIYDFSEKVLSYILRKKEEEYIQPDQDSPVEKMADKLGNSETLAERLQQQYRYDPIRAYRKLKNYRRRRRIRRYSVAAGILLVLGLGWGWFHQNSPGDPLLLTQTIQPGGKKAVLTLADGSVWHIGDSAMLIPTAQNHIRIDSSGMLLQAGKEGRFIFRKQRLEDIMVMVSRWYNVEVYFEDDESKEITFSGGMMRYEGFEALMKMIETVGSINCTIKDNTVFIAKRK